MSLPAFDPERVEKVHAGALFDVYRVDSDAGLLALKVVAESPAEAGPVFAATRTFGSVLTPWGVRGDLGRPTRARMGEVLLASEHERLLAAGAAWDHEAVGLGYVELPGRGPLLALATRWFEGTPLSALERFRQRVLWPKLLPALWDALTVAVHGDVRPDHVLLAPGYDRFALIEPGAMVARELEADGPSSGASQLTFVTSVASYPVLPPFCPASATMGPEIGLAGHLRGYLLSLTMNERFPPVRKGEPEAGAEEEAEAADPGEAPPREPLVPPRPTEVPLAADWLALGIHYYTALAGRPPLAPELHRTPAWTQVELVDGEVSGAERALALLAEPPPPPSRFDRSVTPGEDALALAMVSLAIDCRQRLLDLIAEAERGGVPAVGAR